MTRYRAPVLSSAEGKVSACRVWPYAELGEMAPRGGPLSEFERGIVAQEAKRPSFDLAAAYQ